VLGGIQVLHADEIDSFDEVDLGEESMLQDTSLLQLEREWIESS